MRVLGTATISQDSVQSVVWRQRPMRAPMRCALLFCAWVPFGRWLNLSFDEARGSHRPRRVGPERARLQGVVLELKRLFELMEESLWERKVCPVMGIGKRISNPSPIR